MPHIETVIDEEKKVAHSKLASKTEDVIMDPSKIKYKVIYLHLLSDQRGFSSHTDSCWLGVPRQDSERQRCWNDPVD